MDITCPNCSSAHSFNPDEVTQSGKKVHCHQCSKPFLIKQKPSAPQPGEQRDKVMIANANPHFRSAIKDFLVGHGFMVILATDGVETLQYLEIEVPNVTLVDVALPGMYGFEICDFIKTHERLKHIKVILLASIYDKTRYKRMPASIYGADDYIEMHHIPDQLVSKINRLLGKDEKLVRPPLKAYQAQEFEAITLEDGFSQKIKEIAAEDVTIAKPAEAGLDKAHEEAKRLARIIISDIILYNHELVVQGLREGNLYEVLKDDIKEGQAYYAKRVPAEVRKNTAYLKNTFEEIIVKMKKELGI